MMAKINLKSAFCMVPVHRQDWELISIWWEGLFYIDTCLPFGCQSSPFLFNQVAEALQWIFITNYGIPIIHYLDDFFLVGPPHSPECTRSVDTILQVCAKLGVPVAEDKQEGPSTTITFLGIELDSARQELRLPPQKLTSLQQEIQTWLTRSHKRQLLSLIGKLSFAAKVILAGRLFLHRLIDFSTTVKPLNHHVTLYSQERANIW